ncbi:MAG: peptide-methionine (S)-S-oxide reductase MsrA [Gemmatimonadaceae bacterium]|nr:peptide-methionine (S)-S-oxide reductase MsrA [Gemmatimonadaceae bacterium]
MSAIQTRAGAALAALVAAVLFASRVAMGSAAPAGIALPAPATEGITALSGDQTAVFAGGCFWGVQAVFQHVKGVKSVTSGYAGGASSSPSYEAVSGGNTGHAEAVRVVFDPSQVSYGKLLQVFFSVAHDPTELNFQGPDHGTQYRSAVFTTSNEQKQAVEKYVAQLTAAKAFHGPIVTEIAPLRAFHLAEKYHQNYYNIHPSQPYIVINDRPKVEALKKTMPDLWRDEIASW